MAFQLHNGMGAAFFTTTSWGPSPANTTTTNTNSSGSRSRPGTSSGPATDRDQNRDNNNTTAAAQAQTKAQTTQGTAVLTKDRERKSSFGRKTSFTSPVKSRRRASSTNSNYQHDNHVKTDASAPPAIPSELVLSAKSPKDSETVISPLPPSTSTINSNNNNNSNGGRSTSSAQTAMNGYSGATSPPTIQTGPGNPGESSSFTVHQHIHELANKRISTLDYLRKAYVKHIAFGDAMRDSCPLPPSP